MRAAVVLLLAAALVACAGPQRVTRERAPAPAPAKSAAAAPAPSATTTALLARAQAAVERTRKALPGWHDADAALAEARAAAARGSERRAQNLADEVIDQAGVALDAHDLALAQVELQKAQTYTGLSDAQLAKLRLGELALERHQGRQALATLTALNRELATATRRYVVAAGDSLWIISGREDVYGNPWLWPLLWQANLDTVKDPDRLLAGQKLRVRPNPTIDEVVDAVQYAHAQAASRSVHIGQIRQTAE